MNHYNYDYTFKFILIGDSYTGKTTIANSYIKLERNVIINTPTLGIDFATRIITLPNSRRIKLICWDTAGQENTDQSFLITTKTFVVCFWYMISLIEDHLII